MAFSTNRESSFLGENQLKRMQQQPVDEAESTLESNESTSESRSESTSTSHLGDNVDDGLLHAVITHNVQKVLEHIQNGVDVNAVTDKFGMTALAFSVCKNDVELVQLLLSRGADVNIADELQNYPLHYAAYCHNLPMAKILLSHGANVNCESWRSWTPLHRAAYEGVSKIINYLLTKGANMYKLDHVNWTPLQYALENGHISAVYLFVGIWKMDISHFSMALKFEIRAAISDFQQYLRSKNYDKSQIDNLYSTYSSSGQNQATLNHDKIDLKTIAAYQEAALKGTHPSNQFKIVMLGAEGAGKSSTVNTLLDEEFQPEQPVTIGADVRSCKTDCYHASKWKRVKVLAEIKCIPKRFNASMKVKMSLFSDSSSLSVPTSKASVPTELYTAVREALHTDTVDDGDVRVVILDMGGQEIYYEVHFLFLAPEDVGILVFDASKPLDNPVISRQRSKRFREKIATRGMQTNMQTIEVLLQSVYCRCGQPAITESLSPRSPTILMVGAHAEDLSDDEKDQIICDIRKHFDGRPFLEHLPRSNKDAFHFISNKVRVKAVIDHLKSTILRCANFIIKKECPISYLKFEQRILEESYNNRVRLTREEVGSIANGAGLKGEVALDALLLHYKNKGILLYYPEIELLRDEIFISPQEVSDLLCTVLNTDHCEPDKANLQQASKRFERFALLEEALFDFILSEHHRSKDKDVVISFLKKFNLAVEVPSSIRFDDEGPSFLPQPSRVFFVPSLLVYDSCTMYQRKQGDIVVLFYFPEKILSESVFNQLLVKTINWCYIDGHCISRVSHGTGYFSIKEGTWQQFQLQYNQAISSIECFITIHPNNPPKDMQPVLLTQRKQLLHHLQTSLNDISSSHMPMVANPVACLSCPLHHDEDPVQPHILLSNVEQQISSRFPLVCRYKRKQAAQIPRECYSALFEADIPCPKSQECRFYVTFIKFYAQLTKLTDYDVLSPHLVSECIITVDDCERISKAITKRDKAHVVLRIVAHNLEAGCSTSFTKLISLMMQHGTLATKELACQIKLAFSSFQ